MEQIYSPDDGQVSVIDSTFRLKWEVNKVAFDSCAFKQTLPVSKTFKFKLGNEEISWTMIMTPKGELEAGRNMVTILLILQCQPQMSGFSVYYGFAIKTSSGYWPTDHVEGAYCKKGLLKKSDVLKTHIIQDTIGSTEEISQKFVGSKIILEATLKIFVDGEKYLDHMNATTEFVQNVRSMLDLEEVCDFTITSGSESLKCTKSLLASRSTVFKAKFEHDTVDKHQEELEINDFPPKIVKAMLHFMTKGLIPNAIDAMAAELIKLVDIYGLTLLVQACVSSLMKNLSAENAAETLVLIDQYVPKSEHREKVMVFIQNEATDVVKSKNWKKFSQDYPDLATELFLSSCKRKSSQ